MAESDGYSSVARRYAEAAFGIASDGGALDQWRGDLASIAELAQHPQAGPYLASGRVSDADKRTLVQRALADLSPQAMNLALILLQRDRMAVAPQILAEYDRLLDEARGIKRAIVTTAVPLGDAERRAIAAQLQAMTGAQDVQIETRVDPDIIGGVVARVGDRLIDGSVRTRLVQLKRTLADAAR
jgi:F-type H+-transporting ATPase subunit delta